MNDIDRRISAFLHEEEERATLPTGMHSHVLRRAKLRRLVAAATAAVSIAGVVVGGVVTAAAVRTPEPGPPIPPAESPTPDGQRVVAQGTVEGQTWSLLAYESDSGLCVDLQIGSVSGGGCGFDLSGSRELGVNVGSLGGLSKTIIHGVVSKRVAKVITKLDGGQEMEVDVIDSLGFGVNFLVAFLPPDADGVLEAIGPQGGLLHKERLTPVSHVGDEEIFSEDVLDNDKLTVYYPEGWDRALEDLTPSVDQPKELVSIGTGALIAGGPDCPQIPERAIEALGPVDALVTLHEAGETVDFPDRPKTFSAEHGEVPQFSACLANAEDILFRVFRFEDGGRSFLAYVAINDSASAQTGKDAWGILNSLIVCDRSSPPGDCL